MKKMILGDYSKTRVRRLLNKTSQTYADLGFFPWDRSPQRYKYWVEKYNTAYRKGGYNAVPGLWDGILTEEDYAYFRVLIRKGFRKDTFLSSPAQKEYVKFAEELPFE